MINYNISFIGGIHGVGKTTFCKLLTERMGYLHYSASSLIKEYKNLKKDKKVDKVNENQDILITAIKKTFNIQNNYILDGHFCLLDTKNQIIEVPFSTFKTLNLKKIIVLKDSSCNIHEKLLKRDGINYDIDLIEDFQNRELSYSKKIANLLNIPYKVFDIHSDIDEVINFITSLID